MGEPRAPDGISWSELRASVRRWLLAEGCIRDDAGDLCQEVCLRCLTRWTSFSGRARFTTWLHRLAQNVLADHRRATRRQAQAELEAAERDSLTPRPSVHEQAVRAALARLTPRQRTLLELRFLEGLSSGEVAEELGTRPETVYRELQRARAAFRRAYEQVLGEES